MNGPTKRKMNEKARQYLREHPECTYDELIKSVGYAELSKSYFFNMRNQLRKNGDLSPSRNGRSAAEKTSTSNGSGSGKANPSSRPMMTVEILESMDAAEFSEELKGHFKTHFLPLLKRLVPDGPTLQMVFLSDPPKLEIRRLVS